MGARPFRVRSHPKSLLLLFPLLPRLLCSVSYLLPRLPDLLLPILYLLFYLLPPLRPPVSPDTEKKAATNRIATLFSPFSFHYGRAVFQICLFPFGTDRLGVPRGGL